MGLGERKAAAAAASAAAIHRNGRIIFLITFVSLIAKAWNVEGCNIYEGRWVYDRNYPLYDAKKCPFIGRGFNCQGNGRRDKWYLKYRWQPHRCSLPRFDGRRFLEKLRGKRVMFVGDSLSFNQWQSLTCMLHASVPNSNYTIVTRGSLSSFYFPEYKASILMLKNGFLVDVIRDKYGRRILKLDSIRTGDAWKGLDVLIFNSFHWWNHKWEYFQIGNRILKGLNHMVAYKIAMTTWSKWIDRNIGRDSKTKVFFQGVSAAHINGKEWNQPTAKNCYRQISPVKGSKYPGGDVPGEAIIKSVLSHMRFPVHLLDITLLTQLRKDGHASIYTGNGPRFMDCSHWCLPGVPDTWNQLLYTALSKK